MWGWELNWNAFRNAGMQMTFGSVQPRDAVGVARGDLVGFGDARGGEARGDGDKNGSGSDSACPVERGANWRSGLAYWAQNLTEP